jgi:hypothetical protein
LGFWAGQYPIKKRHVNLTGLAFGCGQGKISGCFIDFSDEVGAALFNSLDNVEQELQNLVAGEAFQL